MIPLALLGVEMVRARLRLGMAFRPWVAAAFVLLALPLPLKAQTGALEVRVSPPMPGVSVVLSPTGRTEETDAQGIARFSGLLVSTHYTAAATVGGTTRESRPVYVLSTGQVQTVIALPFARIRVVTNPGATVTLDQARSERADSRGNVVFDRVGRGGHTVSARLSGYTSEYRQVTVGEGEVVAVTLRLSPEPQVSAPATTTESQAPAAERPRPNQEPLRSGFGAVEVWVDQPATVEIQSSRGRTSATVLPGQPTRFDSLPPGPATLVFRSQGSSPDTQQVLVRTGFVHEVHKRWRPGGGPGHFPTEPLILLIVAVNILLAGLLYMVLRRRKTELPASDLEIVTGRFDQYMVVATLGRGGMATVYRARSPAGGMVALKVMDRELRNDTDLLTKFLREGRVLQTINERYPGAPVVRALRYGLEDGQADGRPFIALEYLEGMHLLEFLRAQGNRLPPETAAAIVTDIARGLDAAHACGVFHRDLTPDNIIILNVSAPTGMLKLIDFGVAKHEFTSVHTLDGSIFGKPPYMSPEQCRGGTVDGRTDLYALGVIYYLLLTGRTPFADRNPLAVMKMHESSPVPALPTHVDAVTSSIVHRLLEKKPGARFQDAADLLGALSVVVSR